MLNKDSWQQGLGVKMHFARMSLFVPLSPCKILKNVLNCCFFMIRFILSVRGHPCKPVPNHLNLKSCLSSLRPCTILPSHVPLFSLPVSLSQVLPWMVFLKWRSPRRLRIQRGLGKGWRGCHPVTSPKTQTELNEGRLLTSRVVTQPVPYLSPKEISSRGGSAMCFFGITINGELASHLQVDPIRSGD